MICSRATMKRMRNVATETARRLISLSDFGMENFGFGWKNELKIKAVELRLICHKREKITSSQWHNKPLLLCTNTVFTQ